MNVITDKPHLKSFIDEEEIFKYLKVTKNPDEKEVEEIIQKSLNKNRLEPIRTIIHW